MQSILEYLKRRERQSYTVDFPDFNDSDAIIKWLDRNGFKQIRMKDSSRMLDFGQRCYVVGPMDKSDPNTCWIQMSDGRETMLLVRTVDNFSKGFYKLCINGDTGLEEITVDEFYQFLEKILS